MNSKTLARIGLIAGAAIGLGSAALAQAWPNQGGSTMGQFPSQQQAPAQPSQPAASGGGWPSQPASGGGGWPSSSPRPAPGGFGTPPVQSGFGPPPQAGGRGFGGPPSPQAVQICNEGFPPLRKEAETRAAAIKAASERKAQREELCEAFKGYVAAEAKLVKFVTDNQVTCGIPADAVKMMKTNHGKSINVRNQVCNAARAGAPTPRAPSLSDALGTSRLPDANTAASSKGTTFDTLTGNPLSR